MPIKRQKIERFLAFLFPIQIIIFHFLSQNKEWVEDIYIPYIFGYLTLPLRLSLEWIDVSIGLISLYLLLIFVLVNVTLTVIQIVKRKRNFKIQKILVTGLAYFSILYGIYMLFWGLAYHRRPYQETRKINTTDIKTRELEALCKRLALLANDHRPTTIRNRPTDFKHLFARAHLGYQNLSRTSTELSVSMPSLKIGYNKEIMSYLNISGIYFPFTAEANLNENLPAHQAPFVICHEMAHQLGFASEDEANYIAYLACMHHPDPEFKYAANHWLLYTSLGALRNADEKKYQAIYGQLNKEIILDQDFAEKIWREYDNPLPEFTSNVLFDLFLKVNDQQAGIDSYNLVVQLMVGEYRKNGLQYR